GHPLRRLVNGKKCPFPIFSSSDLPSTLSDPSGQKTTFAYDENYYLTNVVGADGASFALHWDDSYGPYSPPFVTNITSSYEASVSFSYSLPDYGVLALTNITDAAGISSQIQYESSPFYAGPVS